MGTFAEDLARADRIISGNETWMENLEETTKSDVGRIKEISPFKTTMPGIKTLNRKGVADKKEMNRMIRRTKLNQGLEKLKGVGSTIGNALGSDKAKGIYSGIGAVTDLASTFIKPDEDSSFENQQAIGDILLKVNPGLGAAYKGLSVLETAVGAQTNTLNNTQASAAGITGGQKFVNNLVSNVPFLGALTGAQKTTDALGMTQETQSLTNAFAGSVSDIDTAGTLGGKRYLRGAANKANNLIDEANRNNMLLTDISMTNTQRKQSNYEQDLAQQNINRFAGNNYQNIHMGKNGMKLMSIEECRRILEARKESEVQSFHNGGVIGIDVNVIGEGKYHAHKNHLNEVSEEFEDLTKKGIPVVTLEEGGELSQLAEIEKKEIIFRLEVTTRLEELYEDGSDEAAIEAGKLLAIEICENTQDNSGEVLDNGETED